MSIIQAMLRNVTFHEKCVICHMTYVTLHMIYVIYALKTVIQKFGYICCFKLDMKPQKTLPIIQAM